MTPRLLGIIDDHSRLICHAQWYGTVETTEDLVHGLSQAILKRGLCRSLLTDNGGPMTATETVEGLATLGILGDTTRAYSRRSPRRDLARGYQRPGIPLLAITPDPFSARVQLPPGAA